jgi:hypothetical protein
MNPYGPNMNKFNTYVESLLEADTGVPDPSAGSTNTTKQPSGDDIMQLIYSAIGERPDKILAIQERIQGNPELKEFLDDVSIDAPERMARLGQALGITAEVLRSKGLPVDNVDGDDKFEVKPSIKRLGKQLGTSHQADIERAFWDSMFWISQGTWLKKIQSIARPLGKTLRGLVSPTASGSTGVFA